MASTSEVLLDGTHSDVMVHKLLDMADYQGQLPSTADTIINPGASDIIIARLLTEDYPSPTE